MDSYTKPAFVSKRTNPVRRWLARMSHDFKTTRGPMTTQWQRVMGHVEALFIDHAIFRLPYPNRHAVSKKMWRSSQPTPGQIAHLKRMGIKTIVNLRGKRDCASYYLERDACKQHGVTLVDFPVNSRQPPTREVLAQLDELFSKIEYPALMHCKAGADRAGIMSALYLLLAEKTDVHAALKQLSPVYGHMRKSKAGVLDHFLETYRDFAAKKPVHFMEWAQAHYSRDDVIRTHKISSWSDWLNSTVLRRE